MALTDSLISYWKLDEASGDAVDAHGSNTLSDNNTVGSATGKIGNARDFELANAEYFNCASNASLQTGDIDYSFSLWVNLESKPGANDIVFLNKGEIGSSEVEYQVLWIRSLDRFALEVYNGATTQRASIKANTLGAPSLATWYHIVAWHDSINNVAGIAVNGGSADTVGTSGAAGSNVRQFTMGRNWTTNGYMDGLIDEVGFWKRVLTSGERTELYNGGAGLAYPFTTIRGIPFGTHGTAFNGGRALTGLIR